MTLAEQQSAARKCLLRAFSGAACSYGLKMRSTSSGGSPTPRSATSTRSTGRGGCGGAGGSCAGGSTSIQQVTSTRNPRQNFMAFVTVEGA
jgi:hypothetical protein